MDEDDVIDVTKLINLNNQIVEQENEVELDGDDVLPKVSDPDTVMDEVTSVKGICQVSPMKSKSKVTGKSDSPKIIKKSDKASVVKEKTVDVIEKSTIVKESDKAPVVAAVVIEKSVVDEKDNPKVTSKVSTGKLLDVFKYKRKTELPKDNQKDKESDKSLVVAAVVSEKSAVDEKDNRKVTSKVSNISDESDKAMVVAPVLKEKPADVIEKSTVIKESDKAPVVKETDKVPVIKESDKAPVLAPVLKEKLADVNEKEKPVVDVMSKVAKDKEKPAVDVMSKGNAPSVVGKAKDKPYVVKGMVLTKLPKKKHKVDIPKDKPKPKDKHKVDSEVHVLRSKPEVKAEASISEDVKRKRMLSKEDHSKKKLELKMIKGKMVSDEVDSDEKQRRVLKKLIKIKTEYSDEESGLKSNKKGFSSFHNVSIDKILSRLGRYTLSKFSSTTCRLTFESGDYVEGEYGLILGTLFCFVLVNGECVQYSPFHIRGVTIVVSELPGYTL
ncbi:hypothetical protein Tco_0116566 [Tanacetum coccineum]